MRIDQLSNVQQRHAHKFAQNVLDAHKKRYVGSHEDDNLQALALAIGVAHARSLFESPAAISAQADVAAKE